MLNWKQISDIKPEIGAIIIIAKDGDQEDRSKWLIGQFLKNDDKTRFVVLVDFSEDGKIVLKAENFKYWCYLLEGGYKLPAKYKEADLHTYYDIFRKLILTYEHRFLIMAKLSKTAAGKIYSLDIYFDGIYNRSLSLIHATLTLLDSKNYMAAAHIVRLHLDNFLRLHAAWMVNDPNDFVREVMNGKSVRNLIDRDGKKMVDNYLVREANKKYPWIKEVYEKSCGFIHFSGTHILSNQKIENNEEGTIETYIGKNDWDNVTDLSRIKVLAVMIEISDCILEYAYGWARTKMQEDDLERI